MKKGYCIAVFFLLIVRPVMTEAQHPSIKKFTAALDTIRQELRIPGMAAAIMEGDSILLSAGFGYADLAHHIKATAATPFRVASVTKTFTSTIIMQLVEQGKLNLDEPASTFGIDLGNPAITVRHLLTHTSEGVAGSHYQYNGFRFGRLGVVIEQITGKPFYQLLMEKILMPLKMNSSAPGISLFDYYWYISKNNTARPYFEKTLPRLAKPYEVDGSGKVSESSYYNEFGAFGGLVTCVNDLLKYSKAVDRHQFVSAKTQQLIFSANHTSDGNATPYGLGWFVQRYQGIDFYWHYGQTQGESALFLKIPSRKLTLAVLANCDRLSQPFSLADGDALMSPVAQLFWSEFVGKDTSLAFRNKSIITRSLLNKSNGNPEKNKELFQQYAALNFNQLSSFPTGDIVAELSHMPVNKDSSVSFVLSAPATLRAYGAGENCSGDFSSWCDYGWIADSTGKTVWQMQGHVAIHAGGALKNQRIDTLVTLPRGPYTLHYKSDGGHAYGDWDSLPPDYFFWGIILFRQNNN